MISLKSRGPRAAGLLLGMFLLSGLTGTAHARDPIAGKASAAICATRTPKASVGHHVGNSSAARFAYVTLAGRNEAPGMAWFRQFVREHLHD